MNKKHKLYRLIYDLFKFLIIAKGSWFLSNKYYSSIVKNFFHHLESSSAFRLMNVDSDLEEGIIDSLQASHKRKEIEKEDDFLYSLIDAFESIYVSLVLISILFIVLLSGSFLVCLRKKKGGVCFHSYLPLAINCGYALVISKLSLSVVIDKIGKYALRKWKLP